MQQIILPYTDLKVSRLGFGTASLHHLIYQKDRELLLGQALDSGFTHFDTARLYGEGLAERSLGQFLGKQRHNVTIGTKFGISANPWLEYVPSFMYGQRVFQKLKYRVFPKSQKTARQNMTSTRKCRLTESYAEKSLLKSLNALKTDWIDILFVHEPCTNDIQPLMQLAEWLHLQKAKGKVRFLGLAGSASYCAEVFQKTGSLFDVLQVEDSLKAHEADVLDVVGLPMQISFGYFRKALQAEQEIKPISVLSEALLRNRTGMILVSSRKSSRLRDLAKLTETSRS